MFDFINLLKTPISSSVFFVAELGINHDGEISLVKKMIDAAIEAKADAIKFQLYDTDRFYNKTITPEAHQLFQSFQISFNDFISLKNYAESRGILVFAAPFDTETLQNLITQQIFPIKIASGDALTEPWIDILLEKGNPFIISTGSLEDFEIRNLANKIKGSLSAILYCVSEYPTPPSGFDIRYLTKIQEYIPNQPIGFSDHSQGTALSLAAVSLGAKIIERHFTLFPERTDYDHPLSLSPEQFAHMIESSRMIETALGSGIRKSTLIEQKIRPLTGREAYARYDIPSHTIITEDMIILQRPGQGISTLQYNHLLGKKHHQMISQGTRLLSVFPSI